MADVVIIGGENPVFIREQLQKTMNSFAESDRTIYYGDELHTEHFFSDLMTGSLFSNKRMIVVKHADASKSEFEKLLLNYLKEPSGTVCLVLEYQKIPAKVLAAVEKLGNQITEIHNFKKAWAADLKRYAQRRCSDKEIVFSSSAIDLLVDLSGEDIEELSGMLDRLIAYLGDRKNLSDDDVRFALERAQNATIFDLIDAIFQRNTTKAFESLYDLQQSGESFPAINAMLLRSARIMWAVKTSVSGQVPKGFAVSPYEWKKYQGVARNINLKFLSSLLETISRVEFESKTRSDIFAQTVFEEFLFNL